MSMLSTHGPAAVFVANHLNIVRLSHVHLIWLNLVYLLILVAVPLVILMGSMVFLSALLIKPF